MTTSLVVTVIGPDRPGLVDALSNAALALGANWEQSRMVRLGGQFAGVVLLTVAPERADELSQALDGIAGLDVRVQRSENTFGGEVRALLLDLIGNDRPGILREVARALAARGVNVEELHTECVSAPMTGEQLFSLRARLHAPAALPLEDLRQQLEAIAHDLMVDLQLVEASG